MFQQIIKTVYNDAANDEFIADKTNQGDGANDDEESNSRINLLGKRGYNIIDAGNHVPDNPDRKGERPNDKQTLKKRFCEEIEDFFDFLFIHFYSAGISEIIPVKISKKSGFNSENFNREWFLFFRTIL